MRAHLHNTSRGNDRRVTEAAWRENVGGLCLACVGPRRPTSRLAAVTALMGLDTRLKLARLYCITDGRASVSEFSDLVGEAFAGGVDLLEVRDAALNPEQLLERLEAARDIAFRYQGIVVVRSDAEVGHRFSTDALALGAADGAAGPARKQQHEWALIGRSAHDADQVRAAQADPDTHFLLVGPVFGAATPPVPGPDLIRSTAAAFAPTATTAKPWFAVGGINAGNLDDVLAVGARRVAVSAALTTAADVAKAAEQLSDRLRAAWRDTEGSQQYAVHAAAGDNGGPNATSPAPGGDPEPRA